MAKHNDWICFDGKITAADTPVVPANTRGLMYGEGVFDTLRIYSGKTLFFDRHFNRTRDGLDTLGITIPESITASRIKADIKKLLRRNKLSTTDAIVRLQFWRDGNRGYHPDEEGKVRYAITASECPARFDSPSLTTVDRRRIPSQSQPSQYKFSNGINYILAAQEASQKGADDALMQTVDGHISETTIANVFWRKGNNVFTPSEKCDLLPGITRDIMMELINRHQELELGNGFYELDHIVQAESVWICNSVRELLPVNSINEKQYITNDDLFDELKQRFRAYRNEHLVSL